MNTFNYYLRDAREGIQRNAGAAIAAAALIFIAMTILGGLMLVRFGLGDLLSYVESQVNIKIYIDPSVDTQQMATILESKSFIKSLEIEKKEQLLERLLLFFQGREHLLNAFQDSIIPDAIVIRLNEGISTLRIVEELRSIPGISQVIYPQQLAETVVKWSALWNRYGLILFVLFTAIAFITVFIAINLALYQRQKEIRVKLLLGAKPMHVRGQFLFEGWLIGLLGSLLASTAIYCIYVYMLFPLERQYPFIFHFSVSALYTMMGGMLAAGSIVGLLASYLSTVKLIKHE
jgi:cell division transport system permease protein